MSDPFFKSLRDDWQSHAPSSDVVLRRLRSHRWTPHLMLALEMLGCGMALLAGLWFAWMAVHVESNALLFGLSAAIVLSAAPVLGVATFVTRRRSLRWDEATPEALLETGVRRADASLRAILLGRIHIGVIAGFVIVLWIAEALQFIDARSFLIFYSIVCLTVCAAELLWFRTSSQRLREERDACTRLLEELRTTENR